MMVPRFTETYLVNFMLLIILGGHSFFSLDFVRISLQVFKYIAFFAMNAIIFWIFHQMQVRLATKVILDRSSVRTSVAILSCWTGR